MIAVPATALATVLGTLAALGLSTARFRGQGLLTGLLISPMVVPLIISAVGMYFFYAPLGLTNSYIGLILAHTALGAPFVFVTVSATLAGFDTSLIRAGASLGAPPPTVFFRIIVPLILPGLVSGALFAFATSSSSGRLVDGASSKRPAARAASSCPEARPPYTSSCRSTRLRDSSFAGTRSSTIRGSSRVCTSSAVAVGPSSSEGSCNDVSVKRGVKTSPPSLPMWLA